jgi:hypothetical protein
MADEGIGRNLPGNDCAEQLDFLSAHHVSSAVPDKRDTGHNGLPLTGPGKGLGKIRYTRRAADIRRFHPATVRSDHSGKKQGKITQPAPDLGYG